MRYDKIYWFVEVKNRLEKTVKLEYTKNKNFMRILNNGQGNGCYLSTIENGKRMINIWEKNKNEHCDWSIISMFPRYKILITRPLVFIQGIT